MAAFVLVLLEQVLTVLPVQIFQNSTPLQPRHVALSLVLARHVLLAALAGGGVPLSNLVLVLLGEISGNVLDPKDPEDDLLNASLCGLVQAIFTILRSFIIEDCREIS